MLAGPNVRQAMGASKAAHGPEGSGRVIQGDGAWKRRLGGRLRPLAEDEEMRAYAGGLPTGVEGKVLPLSYEAARQGTAGRTTVRTRTPARSPKGMAFQARNPPSIHAITTLFNTELHSDFIVSRYTLTDIPASVANDRSGKGGGTSRIVSRYAPAVGAGEANDESLAESRSLGCRQGRFRIRLCKDGIGNSSGEAPAPKGGSWRSVCWQPAPIHRWPWSFVRFQQSVRSRAIPGALAAPPRPFR